MLMKVETSSLWKEPEGRNEHLLRSISQKESEERTTSQNRTTEYGKATTSCLK